MDVASLEQIIKQYIHLPPNETGTGWYPILCKVCNDSGRKGARAGFKFEDNKTCYHCFNCGHATVYDPSTHKDMPEKMIQVLNDFGVPEDQWRQVLLTSLIIRDKGLTKSNTSTPFASIEPLVVPLPSHFYTFTEAAPNDKWVEIAKDYLEHERGVDPNSQPFMLAHKTGEEVLDRWLGRVIIPIYKDNQPIFYIGRDLTGKKSKKYLSPSFSKEKVLYGFNELFRQTEEPLYIVEGWFDAYVINGVAILGNEISTAQATWLNKSYRNKVYIPDRQGDGKRCADQALELGWSIATPGFNTWADEVKDLNDAVKKFGKVYVMKALADSIATGFTARTNLGFYCKYETPNKDRSKKKNRSPPKA